MGINQINPGQQPIGANEQATAANAAMITTGADRDINKHKIKTSLDDKKINYKEVDSSLKKISDTFKIKRVKKFDPGKDQGKKQEQKQNKKLLRRGGKEKKANRPFAWKNPGDLPDNNIILHPGETDKFRGETEVNLDLLKKYSALYTKILLGLPPKEENEKKLIETKHQLALSLDLLKKIEERLERYLYSTLAYKLKETLFSKLESPKKIVEFILSLKKKNTPLNFLFFNDLLALPANKQKQNLIDQTIESQLNSSTELGVNNLQEFIKLAHELNIDLAGWFPEVELSKIKIDEEGQIIIDSSILEHDKLKSLLLDEFRVLEVERLTTRSWQKQFIIYWHKQKTLKALQELGISTDEIRETAIQAKKIAWAKCIAELKDLHLKRIFTNSMKQFGKISIEIKKLTIKTRRLGQTFNHKGIKWIEAQIEQMAYDSAIYKLELMKSMQELEFDKERERDIKNLSFTVEHYAKKVKADQATYAPEE